MNMLMHQNYHGWLSDPCISHADSTLQTRTRRIRQIRPGQDRQHTSAHAQEQQGTPNGRGHPPQARKEDGPAEQRNRQGVPRTKESPSRKSSVSQIERQWRATPARVRMEHMELSSGHFWSVYWGHLPLQQQVIDQTALCSICWVAQNKT